jgi:ABC-type sugar transport system substrate-binding protein
MLLTGCSSNSDNPVDGETGASGIAMIVKNGQIDYWRQIETAFRGICQEKDLEAHFYATSGENAYQEQIAVVSELRKLSSKAVKGIIFTPCYGPNGESAEAEVAALAQERGIPVIILDTPVSATSPLASCPYFGTDNTAAGQAMADMVPADKVAVFAMPSNPGMIRAEAFKALKPNAVIYQVGDKASEEVQAVLDEYDDFVFFNGSILVDVLDKLKAEVKNVYTFDVYGEFLDKLIEGDTFFKGIMAQNTFDMTRKAVEAVIANAKQGEMVPTFYIHQYNLDDPNVQPFLDFYGKQVPVIEDLAAKLTGKWIDIENGGEEELTADKTVITFLSPTKATVSYSREDFEETTQRKWNNYREYEVTISGNKVRLITAPNKTITLVDEMVISSITDTEILCTYKHTTYINGEEKVYYESDSKMAKVTTDYREALVGTWESTQEDKEWCWEFKSDGTYVFSESVDGSPFTTFKDEFSEYFVDGPLLCMRWKNLGEGEVEKRDWWEIASLEDNKMVWTVYTQDDSGNPYTKMIELRKLEVISCE